MPNGLEDSRVNEIISYCKDKLNLSPAEMERVFAKLPKTRQGIHKRLQKVDGK